MNILFATTVLPHLETSGGEIASQTLIDALRQAGHDVTVFGYARDGKAEDTCPSGSVIVERRHIETASAGRSAYLWLAKAILNRRPYVCEKFYSRAYLEHLRRCARERPVDILVIDHTQMGWLVGEAKQLAAKTIFVAHNHESALYADQARNSAKYGYVTRRVLTRDADMLKEVEKRLAHECDQIWTLSNSERLAFDALAGRAKARLMELPGRRIEPAKASAPPQTDIALLGNWSWDVNGLGLEWFIRDVLPHIPADLRIRVGGRGSEQANGHRDTLKGVGFVDDPVRFLQEARVIAIPSVVGAGIQIKTIEAIAAGVATVTTTTGARGIGTLPIYVRIADEPQDFAQALVQTLQVPTPDPAVAKEWADKRRTAFENMIAQSVAALSDTADAQQQTSDTARRTGS